ncbi:MAG: pyridoxal phosphate-dependent aminotransferase [Nanoarchaeota archaeon]|nr:pyridoxal phosphate-dependent aminotransferase [Nanoarchaeota archaeon]
MDSRISKRASAASDSITLAITAKANAMKKQGHKVIGFGAGEPDFDTPDNIKEAAISAIKNGKTKYTAVSGIDELKEAIIEKFRKDNHLEYGKENILVSCGAKHSLYNIMQATLNEKDQVIVPAPYWVSYIDQVMLTGAKPVVLKTKNFKIMPEKLEKAINSKTKMLILNSPSNPTGAVYTKEELKKIAEICKKNNILVISDEIYEKLIYDGEHYSIASVDEEMKKLTIVVNGVSKAYSMTGWRIGYCAGDKDIIKAASQIQSHSTSNPTSIAQWAAVEALRGPQQFIEKMKFSFKERRDFMVKSLNKIKGVKCDLPAGAFYVFLKVSKLYNEQVKNSADFCTQLLEKEKVAAIPGSGFGDDNYIRFSYACSMDDIKEGLERMKKFCESLK